MAVITFLLGALGALAVLALLGVGFALGWKCRGLNRAPGAGETDEKELEALREQRRAMTELLSYDVDTVYGMKGGDS